MTNEEAIKELKSLEEDVCDEYGEQSENTTVAIEMAIEALRKQKTAKRINISGTDCQCSNCMNWNDLMDKYCWRCGARLGR